MRDVGGMLTAGIRRCRDWGLALAVVGCLAVALAPARPSAETRPRLAAARTAIASPQTLRRLRSLSLSGHVQTLNLGNGKLLAPFPIELRFVLPDGYVRIERDTYLVRMAGLRGQALLNRWTAVRPGVQFSSQFTPEQIAEERATMARLLLGILAETRTALPLTVTTSRDPHTFVATGRDGFEAALDVDRTSGVPVRVRFVTDVRLPVASADESSAASPASRVGRLPPAERGEMTWEFSERRVVDGVAVPHRLTRRAKQHVFESIDVSAVRVNPPVDDAFFKP